MIRFRRQPSPVDPLAPATGAAGEAAVEFVGIADESLARPDFTPYEFQTEAGVWVRLHDMRFLGLEYDALPRTLTLRFLYDDPAWTPPGAESTPLAVLRFEDVLIRRWEDHVSTRETPAEHRGQVGDLELDAHSATFLLDVTDGRLAFEARLMQVRLLPADRTVGP